MPTEKEYMLEEATAAATYQPKLTAGRNINISEDNVISSPDPPAPGSTVTVTPNQMSGNLIATVTVDSTSYNLYSPIPPVMTGATSGVRGEQGLVPAPSIGYQDYVLYGDGTWKDPEIPNIIANPAVSATTDLTKIYIDGTVYGVSGGGGSSNFEAVEISKASYDLLPTSEKTDQDKIYMVYGEDNFENVNFKQGTLHNQYSMSTNLRKTQASFIWDGGNAIGSEIRFNTPIDITNIDKISYSLTTTTCYGHNNANVEEQENQRFHIRVLLFDTMIPVSDWEADHLNDQSLLTYNSHIYTNTTYTNDECFIDTSNLTGNVYLIISAAGWNCTFTNLQLHMNDSIEKKQINWNNKTWGTNFDSIKISYKDYINLPLAKKEDVSKIYMVSQPELNHLNMLEVTKVETTDAPIYPISENEIDFTYSSGNGPGQWLYFNDAIDVTNIDKIYYSMVTGDNYDTLNSQDNNQRYLAVGLKLTTTSSWAAPYNMGYTLYNEYDNEYTNSTLNDEYLDVSQLTGEYYLTISGVGWNIVFTDIGTLSSNPEYENMIYWNNKCFTSFDKEEVVPLTQSEYDALPSSKLTDNIVYFIHPEQTLDPNYHYVYADNGKIIVRIYHEGESDEEIYWFFNNYSHNGGVYAIPSNLTDYYNTSTAQAATAYDPTTGNHVADIVVNQYGNMGIYAPGFGSFYTNSVNCKLSMNYPDNTIQNTTYEDPHVYINNDAYKIIFNGHEYVNTDIVTHEGLTPEEYELLPIDQKTNGEIYFVSDNETITELVARMTSASSASEGTVSGYDTYPDREPWMAFRTDSFIDVSYVGEFWYGASTDAYIQFDFNNRVNITEIDFASNVAVIANISYSQDGVNYISGANLVYQNTSSCYKENFLLSEELTNCISIRIKPVTQAAIGCVHFIGYPASNNKIYYMGKNYTSGGSGSSSIKTTLLDVNTATSPMNLSDSIFNYDMIFLEIKDGNGYTRGVSFVPSILEIGQVIGFDNTYGYTWDTITSGTVLTNTSRSNFYIASIVGIKL